MIKDGGASLIDDDAFFAGKTTKLRQPSKTFQDQERVLKGRVPFVVVPTFVCKRTGGGNAAILLARLIYWNTPAANGSQRLNVGDRGRDQPPWSASYQEIHRQTGLNRRKSQRALQKLESLKLIEVDRPINDLSDVRMFDRNRPNAIYLQTGFERVLKQEGLLCQGKQHCHVRVRVSEVLVTRTGTQAIVLSSILPWFDLNQHGKRKLTIKKNGHWWRANDYRQISEETGVSVHQVKRAVTVMRHDHLLHVSHHIFGGRRILHVRPNREALKARLTQVMERVC
jgi:hypothetical protein